MTHQTSLNGPYHPTWLQGLGLCAKRQQYAVQYPPEFVSLPQLKGSVIHRMLEIRDGDYNAALDHCIDQMEAPLKEQPDIDLQEEVQDMFEAAMRNMPRHEVILTEYAWIHKINDTITLEGCFDALWEMENGERVLVDYKSGKTLPSQFHLDHNLQFSLYGLACRETGIHIDKIAWVHLRDWLPYKRNTQRENFSTTNSLQLWSQQQLFDVNKNGNRVLVKGHTRGPGVHLTRRNDAQLDETEREVKRLVQGVKFKIFPRCMDDKTCGYCTFRDRCEVDLAGHTTIKMSRKHQALINEMENEDD